MAYHFLKKSLVAKSHLTILKIGFCWVSLHLKKIVNAISTSIAISSKRFWRTTTKRVTKQRHQTDEAIKSLCNQTKSRTHSEVHLNVLSVILLLSWVSDLKRISFFLSAALSVLQSIEWYWYGCMLCFVLAFCWMTWNIPWP